MNHVMSLQLVRDDGNLSYLGGLEGFAILRTCREAWTCGKAHLTDAKDKFEV